VWLWQKETVQDGVSAEYGCGRKRGGERGRERVSRVE